MKNKALIGLIATATIGTAIATPTMIISHGKTNSDNKLLMVNNINNEKTNKAVVINSNSNMNLYALSNGTGIISNLSTGEMLTILGQAQNGYCKVRVQETGAVGYINIVNMQTILNGTNDSFTQLSGNGQIINVSSNVRLRSNPAIGNNIIGYLTNGTTLNILGKQGQWYKVNVNGQIGFIYEEYISTSHANINNQSATNNINNNSGNTNTSPTNSNNSTSNKNSSNQVKNIIVRTKSSSSTNQGSNSNINKNGVTQVNKTVKINLLGKNYINMSKTATGSYYYKIPSGISTVKIISENSSDGMSYIEYNGHYGYVNTKALSVGENNYNQIKDSSNITSNKQISNSNTNNNNVTQINKTVKIYIPGTGAQGMGMASEPSSNSYSYIIPKGVSTVRVISENSYDTLSYIEYDGHYGYVSTSLLKAAENGYLHMSTFKNTNNSKNSGIKNNLSGSYLATVNKMCYIVPKPEMMLSQAEMNSSKYVNAKLSNGAQVLVSKNTSNLPSGWVQVTAQDGVTGYLPISDINTTNGSLSKAAYINQLKGIAKTADNIPKGETTAQMLDNGTKVYNLWNNELNNIYGKLKENLSDSQFKNLEKSELNWINQKNASIENLKQQGGSISAVNALNENIKITQARCYYLVNNYMH